MGLLQRLKEKLFASRTRDVTEVEDEDMKGYEFTSEDREFSHQTRRLKRDIRNAKLQREKLYQEMKLEQARLELEQVRAETAELLGDEDDEEEEGDTPDDLLGNMFKQIMSSKGGTVQQVVTNNAIDFTDEQLLKIKESIPKAVLKQVNGLDDATIVNLIKSHLPGISDTSIPKAIAILKKS